MKIFSSRCKILIKDVEITFKTVLIVNDYFLRDFVLKTLKCIVHHITSYITILTYNGSYITLLTSVLTKISVLRSPDTS